MALNIKELRKKFNLSQQELADYTGIPKGRINGWEQKGAKPKFDDRVILEKYFSELEKKISQTGNIPVAHNDDQKDELISLYKKIEQLRDENEQHIKLIATLKSIDIEHEKQNKFLKERIKELEEALEKERKVKVKK